MNISSIFVLEICCYNYPSALTDAMAGANRIELCGSYGEGGCTPSFGLIKKIIETITIPVHAIIRP